MTHPVPTSPVYRSWIFGQDYQILALRAVARGGECRKDAPAEAGTGGFAQELSIVSSQPRRAAHISPAPADLEPSLIASARIGIEEEVVVAQVTWMLRPAALGAIIGARQNGRPHRRDPAGDQR